MSKFDTFNDTPEQIKFEGQEIKISFTNNGDGTGTVKWNIPKLYGGCSAEDQAYNGIVITISKEPAKFPDTSPEDGRFYASDNTADFENFLGDSINGANVIGAYFDDKSTTQLIVTNVDNNTPYYVSGYALDKQARYHTEGVHAYALPYVTRENIETEYSAHHCIAIDDKGDSVIDDTTGLDAGTNYKFKVKVGCDEYEIEIDGADAQTYEDLIEAINHQFVLLMDNIVQSPTDPTVDKIFKDGDRFKIWDGSDYHYPQLQITHNTDPNTTTTDYVFYPETEILNTTSDPTPINYISYFTQPDNVECGTIWFDGATVWVLEGNSVWCEYETITSNRNPLLAPILECSTYWYDQANDELFKWNDKVEKWDGVESIYSTVDPNNIIDGYYWYDLENEKIKIRSSSAWNELQHVIISDEEPSTPAGLSYWYDSVNDILYQRNLGNTDWEEKSNLIISFSDPIDRESCDLWWNASTSINDLYIWDSLHSAWANVNTFYKTDRDPSLPPDDIAINTAWYNPEDDTIVLLADVECTPQENVLRYPSNPLELPTGTIWYNPVDNVWSEFVGTVWKEFSPELHYENSASPYAYTLYYDTSTGILYENSTSSFLVVEFSENDVRPQPDDFWLNTDTEEFFQGDGKQWVEGFPFISLFFIDGECGNVDKLCFRTKAVGCKASIKVISENDNLFSHLEKHVIYQEPQSGKILANGRVSYRQIGVGDSGDPTERRRLHNDVRLALGHPGVQVELSKQQVDLALDNALLKIRKYSSFGYKRGFFFLDLNANQQHYYLKDKCVGFNKITHIRQLYRLRSGYLHGINASSVNGVGNMFGFAALQQLYSLGTFDMLSYHLVSSYIEDVQRLFADHIQFQFNEEQRLLSIYQSIYHKERVLVDGYVERTEQDLFANRETRDWIKRYATADAKMILSQIRGKFQSLPGPQGSTVLNSQELITQAENEKAELMEEIQSMGMQDVDDTGLSAHLVIG